MQLELNKTYRMRNGKTVTITRFDPNDEEWPFGGVYPGTTEEWWWKRNGDSMATEGECLSDIVELLPERDIMITDKLLQALKDLVAVNEEHNRAMAGIIGSHPGWKDDYLNSAREAIALAEQ